VAPTRSQKLLVQAGQVSGSELLQFHSPSVGITYASRSP
jgi:hypothetical protein